MSHDRTILAISGSGIADGESCSVALSHRGKSSTTASTTQARTDLAVLVEQLCEDAKVGLHAVEELRVDIGPGSYIGLRIAVTFARFVAGFGNARLLATDSLQLLAAAAVQSDPRTAGTRLWPVIPGRAGRLHVAAFGVSEASSWTRETAPKTLLEGEFSTLLAPEDLVVATPKTLDGLETIAPERCRTVDLVPATTLLAAGLTLEESSPEALQPLYLMGSYAE